MAKIFVVAGTTEQARLWIKEHLKKRMDSGETTLSHSEYVIVDSVYKIRGVSDPHGVFVGSWKLRDDILSIIRDLISRTDDTRQLHKILIGLKKTATNNQVANLSASYIAQEIDNEIMGGLSG